MSRETLRAVVVGGGFAGVYAASYLAAADLPEGRLRVTLISDRNYFTFTPLLAEIVGGSLAPQHVTLPLRVLGRERGFDFALGTVERIDPDRGVVEADSGSHPFDFCVLATGARATFLGQEELREEALPFATVADAVRIRNRVLQNAERAVAESDASRRRRHLTYLVAGGGPAGVEVASEIRQLLRETLPRYYPFEEEPRVLLVDADERILQGWDPTLAQRGTELLRERGLEVRLGTRVEGAEEGRIMLEGPDGRETVDAGTLVWTVGTVPRSRDLTVEENGQEEGERADGALFGERGHLHVDEHLRLRGHERVFAAGDSAGVVDPRTDEPYPSVAPMAINQGMKAASNVESLIAGRDLGSYEAHHAGKIVSLGGGQALADILGYRLRGSPAWFLYRATYLAKMVGTKNKIRAAVALGLNRLFERDLACLGES